MKALTPILAAFAIVLLLLGIYTGAYLGLGEYLETGDYAVRVFDHEWQATLFTPAAKAEGVLKGTEGYALCPLRSPDSLGDYEYIEPAPEFYLQPPEPLSSPAEESAATLTHVREPV